MVIESWWRNGVNVVLTFYITLIIIHSSCPCGPIFTNSNAAIKVWSTLISTNRQELFSFHVQINLDKCESKWWKHAQSCWACPRRCYEPLNAAKISVTSATLLDFYFGDLQKCREDVFHIYIHHETRDLHTKKRFGKI